ncbi:MAG: rRNA adenine N-6-methyltransferase [Gammaproteobacteria bacterium]|nr:rRNA adenine N-6-methyltransferase [Gammaproteobacteria bacterium]
MSNNVTNKIAKFTRENRDTKLTFFQGFLRRPQTVGSVIPSSKFLVRRILKLADIRENDTVVELGPGTGGTTHALLNKLGPTGRLLGIEVEWKFVELLQQIDDARLIPHHGSAEDISNILKDHGLGKPDVVISGIPFSTMPAEAGQKIVRAIFSVLPPGKSFVAYQLRDRVAELAAPVFGKPEVSLELINIPPMRVYKWSVKDKPDLVRETA